MVACLTVCDPKFCQLRFFVRNFPFLRPVFGLTVQNTICIFAGHCLKRPGGLADAALRISPLFTTWEFGIK